MELNPNNRHTITIKEVLDGMFNQTIKAKDIELAFGVSNRTVNNRFKALGYKWDAVARKHVYGGNKSLTEEIEALPFHKLFTKSDDVYVGKHSITLPSGRSTPNGGKATTPTPTPVSKPVSEAKEAIIEETVPTIEEPIKEEVVSVPPVIESKPEKEVPAMENNTLNKLNKLDAIFNETKKESNKAYHGVYLDKDISAVLDKVPHGNKSKLINEALRIVFTEQGYLD